MNNKYKQILFDVIKMTSLIVLFTLLSILFRKLGFPETNIVVIYILAVLLISLVTTGYVFGIMGCVISLFCYNYFFTLPYHTLAVSDPNYMITFIIMLATSFITSTITAKEKVLRETATEKSEENQILYQLTSSLSDAPDAESVMTIAVKSISRLLQCNTGGFYLGGQISSPLFIQTLGKEIIHRNTDDKEELRISLTGLREEYLESEDVLSFPINGRENLLGVINISKDVEMTTLESKKNLLHSIIENIAMALDRIEITEERANVRETMERERERANLLRAISHDLRTPLSGIMGTSEILIDMTPSPDKRQVLLKGIYQDAAWLRDLVENILSLTRLQDGKIQIHKEMEAMEEVIGSAVSHIEKSFEERHITVETPLSFKLVPMDAKLIEQVIYNLLDNAVKHTETEEEIKVILSYSSNSAECAVIDNGEGLIEEDIPSLFDLFYTSKTRSSDAKKGMGLGLAICKTVVEAHGGKITASNRKDKKGAEFVFSLPLGE
ncbi:MAG: DUF4118 domain-containing protein [Spirochaetales bacterium]|nr:DUF4118 domain-containing protein [Spirochaetales bacterium]